ncbi:hypothetical protein [Microbacterium sp. TPD7012]|uniref:hypothetical protein n=1 Tax=unclassified Microbacterium TaxID=2609290 RepID=UPI000D51D489|nr:hypothetical protein [Microbacterium sp. TPD7012]PVE97082.1 hypothetical protein DC434_06775 [Microbacterium sp. TPD7012]
MEQASDPRFVLTQVSTEAWAIHDLQYPDGDHRRIVCRIYEDTPTDVEVLWLRDLPLAPRYPSVDDVLESVRRFQDASRATRPIPIPHRPPPSLRRGERG